MQKFTILLCYLFHIGLLYSSYLLLISSPAAAIITAKFIIATIGIFIIIELMFLLITLPFLESKIIPFHLCFKPQKNIFHLGKAYGLSSSFNGSSYSYTINKHYLLGYMEIGYSQVYESNNTVVYVKDKIKEILDEYVENENYERSIKEHKNKVMNFNGY